MQTNRESYQYDIFISYNKADTEFVEHLVKRIESEQYNNRPFRCFFAAWDIQPGENILLRIEEAEAKSRFVGLVMSPDWQKSNWTTLERVIPVYEDPAGHKGRIIPILRRYCEIPPSIKILNWLDFTHEINFEREAKKLIVRLRGEPIRTLLEGAGPTREQPLDSSTAVFQDENLASDLFPVCSLPKYIHAASARVKDRDEVFSLLGEGAILPPFAIREEEQKIYSFSTLESKQSRISELVNEKATDSISTSKFIGSRLSRVVVELLNRSMTAHMRNLGMTYDWNTKKTFFPLETNTDTVRDATWRVGSRRFTRKLVVKSKTGGYYAHRSCKATFIDLSGSIYLKILPGWHFTVDGIGIPVVPTKMTSLSTRWMNIERNHTVLDNVRFWANVLSRDSDEITLDVGAGVPAKISATPLFASIDHGIEGDYRERLWYEAEPEKDEAEQELEEEETTPGVELEEETE